jgi:hypothetical protein
MRNLLMSRNNKSVIPAVVIGLAATVAGFTVALRSLHNISVVEKFKNKFACSPADGSESKTETSDKDSWGVPVPHDTVVAGRGEKRVIHLDPRNGVGSLDSLPGYKVINLREGGFSGNLDPFAFMEDKGTKQENDETIAFLDSVSGDELNGEEIPTTEKTLGKRAAEGYPAAYEAEEVSDYLEQEFGVKSPKVNPKGDITAAIQAHDNIEQLIEAGRSIKALPEIILQHPDQLAAILDTPVEPKKKKKPTKITELVWKDFDEFKNKYSSLIQDAFDASKEDKDFILKVTGKTHGIGARGTVGKTKAGKEFKSFDAKDINAIHKKVNS